LRQLVYSLSAQADLIAIQSYLTEQSGSYAVGRRFVGRLRNHCRKLAASLGTLGIARPDLRADLRCTPFGNYMIFFRYRPGLLEIVAILESHRESGSHFARRDPKVPAPHDG